jgi:hypothetical protein
LGNVCSSIGVVSFFYIYWKYNSQLETQIDIFANCFDDNTDSKEIRDIINRSRKVSNRLLIELVFGVVAYKEFKSKTPNLTKSK